MATILSSSWQTETIKPSHYLDFVADDEILLKGTRIGLEQIIAAYKAGATPEEIILNFRTLTLEQVYVVITYYLLHKEAVEAYLTRVLQADEMAVDTFRVALRQRLNRRHKLQLTENRVKVIATQS